MPRGWWGEVRGFPKALFLEPYKVEFFLLTKWSSLGSSQSATCQKLSALMIYRASLVAHTVKNLPAMQQESWVRFLGREDPLEKGMANHFSILGLRTP